MDNSDNTPKNPDTQKSGIVDKPKIVIPPSPTKHDYTDETPKTTFNDKGNKK